MSRDAEVQLTDGEVYEGTVSIKANGWDERHYGVPLLEMLPEDLGREEGA